MKKPTMVPPPSHRDFGVTLRTQKPRSTWPPNLLREVFLRYLSFPDASAGSWSGLLSSVRSSSGSSDRSLEQPSWMTWVLSYQCLNIFRKICWFSLSNSGYIKLHIYFIVSYDCNKYSESLTTQMILLQIQLLEAFMHLSICKVCEGYASLWNQNQLNSSNKFRTY